MSLNHLCNETLGFRAHLKIGADQLKLKLDGDEGVLNLKPNTIGYNNQTLVSDGQGGVKFVYIESGVYIGISSSLYIVDTTVPTSILPLSSIGMLNLPDRRIGSCYSLELAGNLTSSEDQYIKILFKSGDQIISESAYLNLTESPNISRWNLNLKIIFRNENIASTKISTQSCFNYTRQDGTISEGLSFGGVAEKNLSGDLDVFVQFLHQLPTSSIQSDFCLLSKLN